MPVLFLPSPLLWLTQRGRGLGGAWGRGSCPTSPAGCSLLGWGSGLGTAQEAEFGGFLVIKLMKDFPWPPVHSVKTQHQKSVLSCLLHLAGQAWRALTLQPYLGASTIPFVLEAAEVGQLGPGAVHFLRGVESQGHRGGVSGGPDFFGSCLSFHSGCQVYQFAQATVTKHHSLGGLNNRHSLSPVLEAGIRGPGVGRAGPPEASLLGG